MNFFTIFKFFEMHLYILGYIDYNLVGLSLTMSKLSIKIVITSGEVAAQWLESWTRNPKVMGSNLGSGRDCWWGSE